mmetsp:Transcript_28948/g.51746  ORF Transcript_28948/g.51746 Transcript_28948/m.51746 type:complete len:215 (+) Transcript_28948:456-1100(+)
MTKYGSVQCEGIRFYGTLYTRVCKNACVCMYGWRGERGFTGDAAHIQQHNVCPSTQFGNHGSHSAAVPRVPHLKARRCVPICRLSSVCVLDDRTPNVHTHHTALHPHRLCRNPCRRPRMTPKLNDAVSCTQAAKPCATVLIHPLRRQHHRRPPLQHRLQSRRLSAAIILQHLCSMEQRLLQLNQRSALRHHSQLLATQAGLQNGVQATDGRDSV